MRLQQKEDIFFIRKILFSFLRSSDWSSFRLRASWAGFGGQNDSNEGEIIFCGLLYKLLNSKCRGNVLLSSKN